MSVILDSQQFKTLQQVKGWKFESAQKAVVEKRDYLERAEETVKQAHTTRVAFSTFRDQEKRRLYQEEIDRGGVKLGKISTVNHEIAKLQERLSGLESDEETANQKLSDAQLELQKAREDLMLAQRAVSKYEELSVDMKKQALKAEEQGQELEFEDYQYTSAHGF